MEENNPLTPEKPITHTPPIQDTPLQPSTTEPDINNEKQLETKDIKLKKLILIPLLIIFLLLTLGAAIYFGYNYFQQTKTPNKPTSTPTSTKEPQETPDPTTGWEMYINSKYNYSIKYPTDYSVTETSLDYIRISPGINNSSLSARQTYISIQLDTNTQQLPDVIYKKTLDGKTLRITQIIMDVDGNQKTQIQQTFDQILSTFKFTDLTTDKTANWKTYQNSQYGYQIKIPQTWTVKEEYSPSDSDSQLKPGAKIQMVTLSDSKTSIKIFYEGDWDHGFEPWVAVLNEKTTLGDRTARLVVFKQNKEDAPSDGWAVYSNITDIPNFRIETTYTDEVRRILSTFKFAQ